MENKVSFKREKKEINNKKKKNRYSEQQGFKSPLNVR
jgi:hypothetical protein